MSYETTKVPVEKSQQDLKRLLRKHGADAFKTEEGALPDGTAQAVFVFRREGLIVKLSIPIKKPTEQEERRVWRVLYYGVKSRMEYLDNEVESFEQLFFPHIVNPASGLTIYEELTSTGRVALPDGMLALPGQVEGSVA